MKETHQFYCSSCGGYFVIRLRTNISANYAIVCPSCSHEHFRTVTKGQITSDRHNGGARDRIIVPKTAYSKEPIIPEVKANDASKIIGPDLWARFARREQ